MTSSLEIAEYAIEKYCALQKAWELSKFLDIIVDRDPKVIFEIGVSLGGSLWAMARVLQGPRTFVSIDLPNGPFGGSGITNSQIKNLVLNANPFASCIIIRGDSKKVNLPEDLTPDLVFIDGDHTLDGVCADFYRCLSLINEGGMIALHDIVEHPMETGVEVNRLWRSLKEEEDMRTHEIIDRDNGPWGGIGIVYV